MAEKIGFVLFKAFDGPAPTEYAGYKKLTRRLEPYGHVKSLAETHPPIPRWRTEAPQLNRTPDNRIYKLAVELAPWMDEYYSRVLDKARVKARLEMIERTRFQNDLAELKYYRHVDLLHAWIVELLFERVYRRVGRDHALFEKVAKREWHDAEVFHHEHREKRIAEAQVYPELHLKELVHPFRFEIKQPNEKKRLQKIEEHILADRHIRAQAASHLQTLRILLHDVIFEEVKKRLQHQLAARTSQADSRARWHLHDVLRAFDQAWTHAWDSRDTFRDLVRQGIIEQAELYPKLFRKAIRDPFEVEIREPNQKDFLQKIQEHILLERQQAALEKLEIEAGRQLTRIHKADLAAYRLLTDDQLTAKEKDSDWQDHVLLERSQANKEERHDHAVDAHRVEHQGYQLLAGRMVPEPKYAINTDIITPLPLAMGIQGDPRAPEHVAPTPLRLIPGQQKDLWDKVHTRHAEDQTRMQEQLTENWQTKTQAYRQHLASLGYGEQKARETPRAPQADVRPESTETPTVAPLQDVKNPEKITKTKA